MSRLRDYRPGILICLALLVSLGVGQEEQWLQYRSAPEVSLAGVSVYWQNLTVTSEAPAGVELPEFKTETPYFVQWATPMVSAGHLWIALDRTTNSGVYDRLYIDADGDGHLKDEEPVSAHRMSQYSGYFGPVKVVFEIEDGPVTYHLNIRFYTNGDRRYFDVSPGGWYEGPITVGGEKMQCVLFDRNVNGAFDDKSLDPGQSDRIQIKADKDAVSLFVGRYLDIDGTLYCPQIARDGAFLKLAKAQDVSYGRVAVAKNLFECSFGGENGLFIVSPKDGICRLPVGTYQVDSWASEQTDAEGKKWRLSGTNFPGSSAFEVTPDKEEALEVGQPIVATLDAREREGTYSFSHQLKGKDGERVSLTCNGSRPRAPRLKIVNKAGTYDRTYSFSYG